MNRATLPPVALCCLLLLSVKIVGVPAQSSESPSLELGDGESPPQGEVTLQATLSSLEHGIGSLSVIIAFPTELTEFVRADATALVQPLTLQIEPEVTTSSEAESVTLIKRIRGEDQAVVERRLKSRLRLDISASNEEGSEESIPNGPFLEITFRVLEDTEPGIKLVLETEATALTTDDPSRSIQVVTRQAQISVVESILYGCFFYMH